MGLVEITPEDFGVELSLAYATPENVTGRPIYARPICYLHAEAADKLRCAVDLAGGLGLRLRIFDAFRPTEAQWQLWEHSPDPTFVADPRRGSPHSRGVAIDLTLIDGDGRDLDMGTGFDDFTERAHHANLDVSPVAQRNRFTLLGIMSAAGWDFYSKEWWHYQLFGARSYPLYSDAALKFKLMGT